VTRLVVNKTENLNININGLKITLVKKICEKLKSVELRLDSETNKHINPKVFDGELEKKSDKTFTWESRYIVVTNTKFLYYYTDLDYRDNNAPLGTIELKNIYQVSIQPENEFGGRKNVFMIQTSAWYKKEVQKGARKYYFYAKSKSLLFEWIITLNFLRVKAIYDEFSNNFGLINLPLAYMKGKIKKRMKKKFENKTVSNKNYKSTNALYNIIARKSVMTTDSMSCDSETTNQRNSQLLRRLSITPIYSENSSDDTETQDRIIKMKDNLMDIFNIGLFTILGVIQEVVFDVDNIGMSDDKIIALPQHLKILKETEAVLINNNKYFSQLK
jgi:hypothetical protein